MVRNKEIISILFVLQSPVHQVAESCGRVRYKVSPHVSQRSVFDPSEIRSAEVGMAAEVQSLRMLAFPSYSLARHATPWSRTDDSS